MFLVRRDRLAVGMLLAGRQSFRLLLLDVVGEIAKCLNSINDMINSFPENFAGQAIIQIRLSASLAMSALYSGASSSRPVRPRGAASPV